MVIQTQLTFTVTDITGNTYRTISICLFETFWSIGVILLPLIAYINPSWSSIYLMMSLPTVLYIPFWLLIPDTPRWFLRKGQIDAAVEIIRKAVSVNNTEHLLPNDLRTRLTDQISLDVKELSSMSGDWWSLWKGPRAILYMISVHIAWAVYVTNYNGMLLNVKAFGREYLAVNTIAFGEFFKDTIVNIGRSELWFLKLY